MFLGTETLVGNGIEAQLFVTVVRWEGRRRQFPKGVETPFVDVDELTRLEDEHRWVVIHSAAFFDGIYRWPIRFIAQAVAMWQTVQTIVFGLLLLILLVIENVQSSLFVLFGHSTEHDNFIVPREAGVTTVDRAVAVLMEVGE